MEACSQFLLRIPNLYGRKPHEERLNCFGVLAIAILKIGSFNRKEQTQG